ncbi:hypothetical protein DAETH_41670 (plasmid) [Deinococcus aetherius]|uniref:HTH luxR-type domain-containing protein n=1 Tax=Deinococcus aetherius TaxID=200252 RepID=A0ABM8AK48_9DEIO|nr:hypothetical protein DAETH_41670 [Deinococcus aetherius]
MITLRGPGGIGKTALALHLAHAVRGEYDHVQVVDLTHLRDPAEVLGAVAATLPAHDRSLPPGRLILDFTGQHRTLLVLDNFEQLLPAASHLGDLLSETATLQLVVTSRSALHLHDEREYPVGPLALPERAQHAASSPAVQLFVARAQATSPAFELNALNTAQVIRLCGVLEGVPLALELAAARLRTYALPDLLARLERPLEVLRADFRDRPERLRSLRAAVQWSYDLLSEDDRAVFECCAVFEGSFTPEALTEVWGSPDVLDGAESLLEQSFLQRLDTPDTRWRMLQPLRELAAEHLDGHPQAPLWRERHALYFLKMTEELFLRWEHTNTDDRAAYLPHYPNVRAGMVWVIEQGRADLAYRYLGVVGALWAPFGLFVQEVPLVERVLALPAPADRRVLLRALEVSVDSLNSVGQYQARNARLREVLALCRELGDVESAAWASLNLIPVAWEEGRGEEAWETVQRVLREYRERVGDGPQTRKQRMLRASAHLHGALTLLELGRHAEALEYATLARQYFREAGNAMFDLESGTVMGMLMLHLHRLPEARTLLLACLHDAADKGFRGVAEEVLRWGLIFLAARLQDWNAVAQFTAFVNDPAFEYAPSVPDRQLRHDIAQAREALGEAGFRDAWEAGTHLRLPDVVELAERLARGPRHPPQRSASGADLTPREREVLALVSQGHPDRRIARLLGISPGTASKHVGNLLGKLGLRNRVELTRWAIEQAEPDSA